MNKNTEHILIVDDEIDICEQISEILKDNHFSTKIVHSSEETIKSISEKSPILIILDIWLNNSKLDGFSLLKKIKTENPQIPIIMISGHGNIETAINSIKNGAFDFIEKPFDIDILLLKINKALENVKLKEKIEQLSNRNTLSDFVHKSEKTKSLRDVVMKISKTESNILLSGPAGSGKEFLARLIHQNSNRSKKSFQIINCANLDNDSFEKKLFGIEKNNSEIIKGALEEFDEGTILFDQIEDLSLSAQGKMIGFLEGQKFSRHGGVHLIKTNVRIISSTKSDLEKMIDSNLFREDLYFKLNVIPIIVPTISQRKEDIPELVKLFTQKFIKKNNFKEKVFSEDCILFFQSLKLSGNIRQLKNLVEWILIILSEKNVKLITQNDIPIEIKSQFDNKNFLNSFENISMKEARDMFERQFLNEKLRENRFNINKLSKMIGMERTALYRKLKSLKIDISELKK